MPISRNYSPINANTGSAMYDTGQSMENYERMKWLMGLLQQSRGMNQEAGIEKQRQQLQRDLAGQQNQQQDKQRDLQKYIADQGYNLDYQRMNQQGMGSYGRQTGIDAGGFMGNAQGFRDSARDEAFYGNRY